MTIYAEVHNNVITNIVQCDADFAAEFNLVQIDNLNPVPGIGWTLAAGVWQPPVRALSDQNKATLQSRALTALANNVTFLGLASPSNAQSVAQVQALTRQVNGLIRLLLNQFDSVADS